MRYPLSQLDAIPAAAQQALAAEGVHDTDHLLWQGTTPAQRRRLAERTGVPVDQVTQWAGIADLLRIKGIGPAMARQLVMSGAARSVQEFAGGTINVPLNTQPEPTASRAQAQQVLERMQTNCSDAGIVSGTLPLRRLADAVEEAWELRPRLLLAEIQDDVPVGEEIQSHRDLSADYSRHSTMVMTALLVLAIGLLLLVGYVILRVHILNAGSAYPAPTTEQVQRMLERSNQHLLLSTVVLAVLLFIGGAVSYGLYKFYDWCATRWLLPSLFDHALWRTFLRRYMHSPQLLNYERRAAKVGLVVFGALCAGLVVLALTLGDVNLPDSVFWERLVLVGGVGGGILAAVIVSGTLFYFVRSAQRSDLAAYGARGYVVYTIVKAAGLPIAIVFLTVVMVPIVGQTYQNIQNQAIGPAFRSDIAVLQAQLEAIQYMDPADQARHDAALTWTRRADLFTLEFFDLTSGGQDAILEQVVSIALRTVSWTAIVAVVLMFVVPYLALGGLYRGLFYALLIAASFWIEDALQTYAPGWFRLPGNSVAACLIIAIVVFANALFFDWVYDAVADRQKLCPACSATLGADDGHCRRCGFVQPPPAS